MNKQEILKEIIKNNGVPQRYINIIDNYIVLKKEEQERYHNYIVNTKDNYVILEHNGTMELRQEINKENIKDLCNNFKNILTNTK